MVRSSRQDQTLVIVAKPNHSSSWRTNLWVLLMITVPSLGAAIGFSLLGAWPILPFAGAELAALGGALYYVNWKLEYRHVITLDAHQVLIDKGHYAPRRRYRIARDQAALAVTPERHPWEGPGLTVHGHQDRVIVGEFLNRDDRLKLLGLLKKQSLPVGTYSPSGVRQV